MLQSQAEKTWFLAQSKPNSHKIAERNLQRQGFQTFLPLHEETKRKAGQFTTSLRPLFTGYLFVAFDAAKGGWRAINSTYGVTRLVSFGDDPQPVPNDLISNLVLRCDQSGRLLPPRILKTGDTVEISSGPFADFVATVEKVDPDQRVWMLLELMGRATRVVVHQDALRQI